MLRRFALTLLLLGAWFPHVAGAQTGGAPEGALDFLLPTGARALGMGQAVVAAGAGSDAMWWNPALISRGPREVALNVTQTFATQGGGSDAAGAFVYSARGVGSIGLMFRYVNTGQQDASDESNLQSGAFMQTSMMFGATFAAPFGDHFSAGFSAKVLRIGLPCTGSCNTTSAPPQTGALDLGVHYTWNKDSLITLGAVVRNVGPKLQIQDAPQADALPGRFEFGVATMPRFKDMPPEVRFRAAADVVARLSDNQELGYRLGGEVSYQNRYQARAGYVINGPTGSGFSFGAGIATGRLQIDLARFLSESAAPGVAPPTFLTLRYLF
ncbi:MAG TPA: PorV/PorQ family protein [Gemmatimonadaceae bacterium]